MSLSIVFGFWCAHYPFERGLQLISTESKMFFRCAHYPFERGLQHNQFLFVELLWCAHYPFERGLQHIPDPEKKDKRCAHYPFERGLQQKQTHHHCYFGVHTIHLKGDYNKFSFLFFFKIGVHTIHLKGDYNTKNLV
jgi:hypothetical protein